MRFRPWTIWGDVTNVLMCYGHLLWLNIIVCLVCLSMPRGYLCLAQSATAARTDLSFLLARTISLRLNEPFLM